MKHFRIQGLALAGVMLFLPLAPLWSAARAAQEKPPSSQHAPEQKPEKRLRGPRDMADGQIKDVACKSRALDMTFDGSDETLHLHTGDYFKVEFGAINFTPSGTLNPCKTAKGMYARVYYYHVKGHPHEGDLISVELRK